MDTKAAGTPHPHNTRLPLRVAPMEAKAVMPCRSCSASITAMPFVGPGTAESAALTAASIRRSAGGQPAGPHQFPRCRGYYAP